MCSSIICCCIFKTKIWELVLNRVCQLQDGIMQIIKIGGLYSDTRKYSTPHFWLCLSDIFNNHSLWSFINMGKIIWLRLSPKIEFPLCTLIGMELLCTMFDHIWYKAIIGFSMFNLEALLHGHSSIWVHMDCIEFFSKQLI